MGQAGYTRAEDEEVWVGMVGGDCKGEEEVKKVKEDNPPPQGQSTTPQNPRHQN